MNHVISRTALPGLPIKDIDKDYLLGLIKRLSRLYFVDVLGFAIMGNHFHLVARMHTEDGISNSDIIKRWQDYYGDEAQMPTNRMAEVKKRLCSLGAYVKDIKQNFTRLNAAVAAPAHQPPYPFIVPHHIFPLSIFFAKPIVCAGI